MISKVKHRTNKHPINRCFPSSSADLVGGFMICVGFN